MKKNIAWFFLISFLLISILLFLFPEFFSNGVSYVRSYEIIKDKKLVLPPLDTLAYDKKINEIANNLPTKVGTPTEVGATPIPPPTFLWPVETVYPNAGAILPFKRIIAYYGNLYSKKMGVLGEYPENEMLQRLDAEVKKWQLADPDTPVVPALHYIAVVAQSNAGADGKYRFRMPSSEIDKVLAMAAKVPARNASGIADAGGNALVFLDIQVGFSNLQAEVPLLEKYLKLPNVHLGVDPEFSMKTGIRPGKVVGTYDAKDI